MVLVYIFGVEERQSNVGGADGADTAAHRAGDRNHRPQSTRTERKCTDTQGTRTETTESPSPRLTRPLGDLKNEGSLGVGCNTTETFELNRMDLNVRRECPSGGEREGGERREEQGGMAVN